jgi:hypothetical protein
VNYGLDTEIFDSEKFPHVQTFVREAIQNSLDARRDRSKPVTVHFGFHSGGLGSRKRFLSDLAAKKQACGLSWPLEWADGNMTWLVVEDSNSSGLNGDLGDRTSDFWNYWLNFGISNKNGTGRGGRGIGRITFLIASGISTVIGVTRRAADDSVAACGMSLLKPGMIEGEYKSSYAYLAKCPNKSIYDLYSDKDFTTELADAFALADYSAPRSSGLSLIIPFPHPSLTKDGIIAASIEHFAPAIIAGALVVEADDQTVDATSIDAQALRVATKFPAGPLREDPPRFLALIRQSDGKPDLIIRVKKSSERIAEAVGDAERDNIRTSFLANERITIGIDVPLTRGGETTISRLCAALAQTPKGRKPTDLFFREGMCLPEVAARNAADVDLVVQSTEGELVAYLNFCEGKAHLGLIENKEVTAKLVENGFLDGYSVKRLVRRLMDELRGLVLPDATKPDASIFSGFFSIPKQDSTNKKDGRGAGNKDKASPPPPPPPPLPPPRPRIFHVDDLDDGFRIRANPGYAGWPVSLKAEVAYADGSRRPKWSRYDFELKKMPLTQTGAGAKADVKNNILVCRDCGPDFQLEIRGFDVRRELVTNVRPIRNA